MKIIKKILNFFIANKPPHDGLEFSPAGTILYAKKEKKTPTITFNNKLIPLIRSGKKTSTIRLGKKKV